MKRTSLALTILSLFTITFQACTKIDTTDLGSGLIPAVDNVHTFEMTLNIESDIFLVNDSTRAFREDNLPLGEIFDDPEFGRTTADLYFNLSTAGASFRSDVVGANPFVNKDSVVKIDSVILSLGFKGIYGDSNSVETFKVFEIDPNSGFKDSSYLLANPDIAVSTELGSKTVTLNTLNDSIQLIRKTDTSKVVNVLRIPLANSLGTRFSLYDTSFSANGGYRNDSIFKTLFKGLAVKAVSSSNNRALAYFGLSDANTKLIIYYQMKRNGVIDTTSTELAHITFGQACLVKRTPAHGYQTNLTSAATNESQLYIQSTPGSYVTIKIPGLDTLTNKVIHLAQLVAPRVTSVGEDIFTPPNLLFLDMLSPGNDTAYTIQNDFELSNFGINFDQFGGRLKTQDNAPVYHFNISRHVQGIVTRKEPNFTLRLYAPYETNPVYFPPGKQSDYDRSKLTRALIPVGTQLAGGRVVVGGGANSNPALRMKLRIIYSKI